MSLIPAERLQRAEELMDDPGCDTRLLLNTVRQFSLINLLFSASRRLIKRHLLPLMTRRTPPAYSLLDIGAGGCDTVMWLAEHCRKQGIPIRITCVDSDPRIVDFSRRRTREHEEIESLQLSAFDLDRLGDFDFIFSNHFLHHFADEEVAQLLEAVGRNTRMRFLMNDLRRAKWPYIGYRLFAALFLHRSFAGYDGALSILRGFTTGELRALADRSSRPELMRVGTALPGRVFVVGEGAGRAQGAGDCEAADRAGASVGAGGR